MLEGLHAKFCHAFLVFLPNSYFVCIRHMSIGNTDHRIMLCLAHL